MGIIISNRIISNFWSTRHGKDGWQMSVLLETWYSGGSLATVQGGKRGTCTGKFRSVRTQDTLSYKGIEVKYTKPLDVKPKVLARSMHLLPGDTYSFWRQNRTQTSLARLGIFKYTNLNVTRADSVKSPVSEI